MLLQTWEPREQHQHQGYDSEELPTKKKKRRTLPENPDPDPCEHSTSLALLVHWLQLPVSQEESSPRPYSHVLYMYIAMIFCLSNIQQPECMDIVDHTGAVGVLYYCLTPLIVLTLGLTI